MAATLVADDPAAQALPDAVERFPCDVRDTGALARVLAEVRPGVIYHLAGLARGDDLAELLAVNVLGTASLLSAASQLARPPRDRDPRLRGRVRAAGDRCPGG